MANKENKSNGSDGYALGFSVLAVAFIVFLLPNEYKFKWSNTMSVILFMISSVGFAYELQKAMPNAVGSWDNLGTSFALFYILYGIIKFLINIGGLNRYSIMILLMISLISFFGFFKGIINLFAFVLNNFKKDKRMVLDIFLKLIPVLLPVVTLILQILEVI